MVLVLKSYMIFLYIYKIYIYIYILTLYSMVYENTKVNLPSSTYTIYIPQYSLFRGSYIPKQSTMSGLKGISISASSIGTTASFLIIHS